MDTLLAPTVPATTATHPAQAKTNSPRHPARYRLIFTAIGLPVQTLLFDELPVLARSPPRNDEQCKSIALAHSPKCKFKMIPRALAPCCISTLNSTRVTTRSMIKYCPSCISLLPKTSDSNPNESYAVISNSSFPAWNTAEAKKNLTYHVLPPPKCPHPHNPTCLHYHCDDENNCSCNAPATMPVESCSHSHCTSQDPLDCHCATLGACTDPGAHYPAADGESHPNCNAPHCPDVSAHSTFTPESTASCRIPHCSDPAAHLAAQSPVTPDHFNVTLWYEYRASLFESSTLGRTFALDCKKLLRHFLDEYPITNGELDLPEFPLPPDNPAGFENRLLSDVIRATHSRKTIKTREEHLTHECLILSCPIRTLATITTGSTTKTKTSFRSLLLAGRSAAAARFTTPRPQSPTSSEDESSDDDLNKSDDE